MTMASRSGCYSGGELHQVRVNFMIIDNPLLWRGDIGHADLLFKEI